MRSAHLLPALLCTMGLTLAIAPDLAQAQSQPVTAPMAASGTTASGTVVQQQQGPGLPPVNAHQDTYSNNNREVFRLLGLSGQLSAPVTPAYNADAAYRTFAGQPMRGGDAVMAQSMDGAP